MIDQKGERTYEEEDHYRHWNCVPYSRHRTCGMWSKFFTAGDDHGRDNYGRNNHDNRN